MIFPPLYQTTANGNVCSLLGTKHRNTGRKEAKLQIFAEIEKKVQIINAWKPFHLLPALNNYCSWPRWACKTFEVRWNTPPPPNSYYGTVLENKHYESVPQRYQVLISGTCKCYFIWKKGSLHMWLRIFWDGEISLDCSGGP